MNKVTTFEEHLEKNLLKTWKRIVCFLLFGLFISLLLTGCAKESNESVSSQTNLPTITTKPNQNVDISRDSIFTFNWKISGDFRNPSVSLDGNIISDKSVGEFSKKMTSNGIHTFIVSCESMSGMSIKTAITVTVKDPIFPLPIISVSANPTHVQINGVAIINLNTTNVDSVASDMPGVTGISGSFPTPPLTENVTYRFIAYGKGGSVYQDITITVDPPISGTLKDILISHPWSPIYGIVKCSEEEEWRNLFFLEEELALKFVFEEDGTWNAYRYGVLVGYDTFSITESDSTFIWGGGYYKIKVLNPTTWTLRNDVEPSDGCPNHISITERTFGPTTLR